MQRIIAFVDGFTLYHSLLEKSAYRKYKWLNIRKLVEIYAPPKELKEIYYFTVLTTWSPDKLARHKLFIKLREKNLAVSLFDDHLLMPDGTTIIKPPSWS